MLRASSAVTSSSSRSYSQDASLLRPKLLRSQPSDYGEDHLWNTICVRVLPLFAGEGLNGNIEELNELVNRYLDRQLYGTVLEELKAFLRDATSQLLAKFDDTQPDKFFPSLIEIWSFYFGVVLPYFQAVFLPLQLEIKGSKLVSSVRILALQAFRDNVVYPLADNIAESTKWVADELQFNRASLIDKPAARLMQMLLVLSDLKQKSVSQITTGTTPPATPTGEISPELLIIQSTEIIKTAVRGRRKHDEP